MIYKVLKNILVLITSYCINQVIMILFSILSVGILFKNDKNINNEITLLFYLIPILMLFCNTFILKIFSIVENIIQDRKKYFIYNILLYLFFILINSRFQLHDYLIFILIYIISIELLYKLKLVSDRFADNNLKNIPAVLISIFYNTFFVLSYIIQQNYNVISSNIFILLGILFKNILIILSNAVVYKQKMLNKNMLYLFLVGYIMDFIVMLFVQYVYINTNNYLYIEICAVGAMSILYLFIIKLFQIKLQKNKI